MSKYSIVSFIDKNKGIWLNLPKLKIPKKPRHLYPADYLPKSFRDNSCITIIRPPAGQKILVAKAEDFYNLLNEKQSMTDTVTGKQKKALIEKITNAKYKISKWINDIFLIMKCQKNHPSIELEDMHMFPNYGKRKREDIEAVVIEESEEEKKKCHSCKTLHYYPCTRYAISHPTENIFENQLFMNHFQTLDEQEKIEVNFLFH